MMHGSDIMTLKACLLAIWRAHDSYTWAPAIKHQIDFSAQKDDKVRPHSRIGREKGRRLIGSSSSAGWDYSPALMFLIILFSSGQNISGIKIYGLSPSCVILFF